MPLQTFNFPNHRLEVEYPTSSTQVQFNNSWVFTMKPSAPDQRIFKLSFAAMRWYMQSNGTIDLTTDAANNVGALDKFYRDHLLYQTFYYASPYGTLTVRFKNPLVIPKGEPGGFGVVKDLSVEFLEQPL